ncbi:MAG: hypothetical protein P4L83_07055 [Nevskia sp.]|nr:hypothetical protein [Nevskia sp.]
MIKTILAPLTGTEDDQAVLDTALALAGPFGAHVECFHDYVDAADAAAALPQVSYLQGAALRSALEQFSQLGQARAAAVLRRYSRFRELHAVPERTVASPCGGISASLLQISGSPVHNLVQRARHHDLTVMARAQPIDGLPADLAGRVLREGGQPLLLVPRYASDRLLDTVMVCWKDTAQAARALATALPLLQQAKRVLLTSVDEGGGVAADAVQAALRHLAWHGVNADPRTTACHGRLTMDTLWHCAQESQADLLVLGAYSHGPTRELLFGGCTDSALSRGELPVLLV